MGDSHVQIGLTLAAMRSLGLASGSYVKLSTETRTCVGWVTVLDPPGPTSTASTDGPDCNRALAAARAMGCSYAIDVSSRAVYLPPQILSRLALTGVTSATDQKHIEAKPKHSLKVEPWSADRYTKGAPHRPPWGSRIVLARVRSPVSSRQIPWSAALRRHFNVPRTLQKGDVITVTAQVPTMDLDSGVYQEDEEDEEDEGGWQVPTSTEVLHFLVAEVRIEGVPGGEDYARAVTADVNHTSLAMQGEVNAAPPPGIRSFLSSRVLDDRMAMSGMVGRIAEAMIHFATGRATQKEPASETDVSVGLNDKSGPEGLCVLLHGRGGVGKRTAARSAADQLGLHLLEMSADELSAPTPAETGKAIDALLERGSECGPCMVLLTHLEHLVTEEERKPNGEVGLRWEAKLANLPKGVVVVACTDNIEDLTVGIRRAFIYEFEVEPPDENQRAIYFGSLVRWAGWGLGLDMKTSGGRMPGYLLSDIRAVARAVLCNTEAAALEACPGVSDEDVRAAGVLVCDQHVMEAVAQLAKRGANAAAKANIPNVQWKDVGGLATAKKEILDTVQLPLEHPELFAAGLGQRSGIILYGPPGTGKTLLAKAVATECKLSFISVKGPELINSYIGESEKNIREVFRRARDSKPCVIFFDELDALAPNRGVAGDSGGVMDRIVSQLLAEMDGMDGNGDVFVLGATNRLDLLDQSLLRPGRFDRQVYLGLPEDPASRYSILAALTRKFNLGEDVDLLAMVEQVDVGFTGADFYALASDALMNAIREKAGVLEKAHGKEKVADVLQDMSKADRAVVVSAKHFEEALSKLKPSLTAEQVKKYRSDREADKAKGAL